MNYRLVILTHGDSERLAETLGSYVEYVYPGAAEVDLIYDGPGLDGEALRLGDALGADIRATMGPLGFCRATEYAWEVAAEEGLDDALYVPPDYVLYLEHDFTFLRPVDLRPLAMVLRVNRSLAQISLMRQPVNDVELAEGSVVGSFAPGVFQTRTYIEGRDGAPNEHWPYLEHKAYFTTNPSLMRRDFMADNPWPDGPECEGKFGLTLKDRGYHFGVWGMGEAWVEHTGDPVRTGKGY